MKRLSKNDAEASLASTHRALVFEALEHEERKGRTEAQEGQPVGDDERRAGSHTHSVG